MAVDITNHNRLLMKTNIMIVKSKDHMKNYGNTTKLQTISMQMVITVSFIR